MPTATRRRRKAPRRVDEQTPNTSMAFFQALERVDLENAKALRELRASTYTDRQAAAALGIYDPARQSFAGTPRQRLRELEKNGVLLPVEVPKRREVGIDGDEIEGRPLSLDTLYEKSKVDALVREGRELLKVEGETSKGPAVERSELGQLFSDLLDVTAHFARREGSNRVDLAK